MKILIVDDNADDRKIMRCNLEHHGCQVLEAIDGQDALEAAARHRPDMIVSDALMPRLDGFQLLRALRGDRVLQRIPFIFYSATYTGDDEVDLATALGATAYIIKPKDPVEFWQELSEIIPRCDLECQATVSPQVIQEDHEYLVKYSNIVANKLEQKVRELEQALVERRQAEEALKKSEGKYRAIFENVQDVFYQVDLAGKIIEISPSIRRYSGYSREELLGKPISDYYDTPAEREGLLAVIQERGEAVDYELRLKTRAGDIVHTSVNAHLLRDELGRTIGMEGSLRDITERKRMEEQIIQAKIVWEETFDTINDAITIHDSNFTILRMNKAAERLIDLPQHDICTQKCYESFHGTSCPLDCCPAYETLKTGKISFMERFEPKLDKFIEVRTLPRFDQDNQIIGLVHIVVDITERKKAEQENKRLQAQLFQAQKMESVGRLAGGVAHDFNNMIGVITGYADLSLDLAAAEQNVLLMEYLKEIRKAARRSADLTRQLLAFARQQVISPKVLDLNDTVAGMLKIMQRLIGEDIELLWKPGVGLGTVKVDPSQVDQILANLCVNARDAIAGVGKIIIETHTVSCDQEWCASQPEATPGDYVMLAVSDDGCGMEQEIIGKLFEPFFTTKELGKGTGLGLATVYGIVKQNNGFINVYSEPGQGTTFKIYLPLYAAPEEAVRQEGLAGEIVGGNETIILVEDDAQILALAQLVLEMLGYRVLAAATPGAAIQIVGKHVGKISLLITDVVMPEMNGRELATELGALCQGLKVLFMSGYTGDIIAQRGVLDENVNFIQKPFSSRDLAAKVREVLGSK